VRGCSNEEFALLAQMGTASVVRERLEPPVAEVGDLPRAR
jgi:hypothetical protein